MTTEAESITTTTAKSMEEEVDSAVSKIAAEAGIPTWGLVAILIGILHFFCEIINILFCSGLTHYCPVINFPQKENVWAFIMQ